MTNKQKQHLLAFLGYDTGGVDGIWGPKSEEATRAFQRDFDLVPDGVWGQQTDFRIREVIGTAEDLVLDITPDEPEDAGQTEESFWDHIRYWSREEWRCQCGGRFCNGFPAEPDQTLVELVDDLRHRFGRPGHRSSGLRCQQHNANEGGVWNSKHMSGKALDFFIEGVSGAELLAAAQADPRTSYAYIIGGQYVHVDVD